MIPVSVPIIGDEEIDNVVRALRSGMIASGEWVAALEEGFSRYLGTEHAVATTSGTAALDIALKALGIKDGDEVIVPDFTFISTASSVLFQGARPVFADVDEHTFNIHPEDVLEKITPRTRAVIGVHLFGHPFDVRTMREICDDHGLQLIEDCAQAHGAEHNGKKVGSFGDVSCFSFYATKPMTTAEGGMVACNSSELAARLRLLINHGQSEKYLHTTLGYNYRMSNVHAAIGVAQLKRLDALNDARIKNAHYLTEHVSVDGIHPPVERAYAKHIYHQYVLKIGEDAPVSREQLITYLKERGVGSAIHYPLPVHSQPLYRALGYAGEQCPTATQLAGEVLSIPAHPALTDEQLEHICGVLNALEG